MHVIGTWKNQLDYAASVSLARQLSKWLAPRQLSIEVTVCPPMIALAAAREVLPESVTVGSQNVIWDAPNAFTGETSASAVAAVGCGLVMIGHSERRVHLREDDEQVAMKVATVLQHAQLTPLICVGETGEEREAGETSVVLERQFRRLLPILNELTEPSAVMVAYEPAWAITTNPHPLPANPERAASDHRWLRDFLREKLPGIGQDVPLIYGAGVSAANVADFLSAENVDGVLVGGASQSFGSFTELISSADEVARGALRV